MTAAERSDVGNATGATPASSPARETVPEPKVAFADDVHEGHRVTRAADHAQETGDGTRAALPPQPAAPRIMTRRIPVTVRQPFVPAHHGHAASALRGHQD